jgi:hypothetical protein
MLTAVLAAILTAGPTFAPDDPAALTAAFRAAAPTLPMLTAPERALLTEWLNRPT